jgi:hypothetical protein
VDATATLRTLRRSGYSAAVAGGKLKLRGPAKPPEGLEARLLEHRDELVRLVEEDAIVDELEAFELAREFFGGESGEEEGAGHPSPSTIGRGEVALEAAGMDRGGHEASREFVH